MEVKVEGVNHTASMKQGSFSLDKELNRDVFECTFFQENDAIIFAEGAEATVESLLGYNATIARSDDYARKGLYSVKVTSGGEATVGCRSTLADSVTISAGNTYRVKAWFRPTTQERSCYVVLAWYTSADAFISADNGTTVVEKDGHWVSATVQAVAPTNAAKLIVYARVLTPGSPTGELHYVDDLTLYEVGESWQPARGDDVQVVVGGAFQFGGTITSITHTSTIRNPPIVGDTQARSRQLKITALGYSEKYDYVLVTADRASESLATRIAWLHSTYIAPRFSGTQAVTTGSPTLPAASYKQQTTTNILNELSQQSGWIWYATYANVLAFVPVGDATAPLDLSDSNSTIQDWEVEETDLRRVERLEIRVGSPEGVSDGTKISRVGEKHIADGTRIRYSLKCWPVVTDPTTVEVHRAGGTTDEDVDGVTWLLLDDGSLVQNTAVSTKLLSGEFFLVSYESSYPVSVRADTGAEPLREENIGDAPEGATIDQAFSIVSGELTKRADTPKELTVKSRVSASWFPGQSVTVSITDRGVDGAYLLTGNRIREDLDGQHSSVLKLVEGGTYRGRWADQVRSLFGGSGAGTSVYSAGGGAGSVGTGSVYLGQSELGISGSGWLWPSGAIQARLNGDTYPNGAYVSVLAKLRVAGSTAQFRLYDDDSDVSVGTSPLFNSTALVENLFLVTLTPGTTHLYRLEINVADGSTPVIYSSYLFPA
ncbi:MAG: hypothetical protein ACRD2X_16110 [Vicinamibacteraceae bacterium]